MNKIIIGGGVASLLLVVVIVAVLEGLCCYFCCAPMKMKMPITDEYEMDLSRGFQVKDAREFNYRDRT